MLATSLLLLALIGPQDYNVPFSPQAAAGDPDSVCGANLIVWLKPESLTTGEITTWSDSSGEGNDFTAPGNGPDTIADALDGYKGASFDAANSEYLTAAVSDSGDDLTVVAVVQQANATPQGVFSAGNGTTAGDDWSHQSRSAVIYSQSNATFINYRDSGETQTTGTAAEDSFFAVATVYDGTDVYIWLDGTKSAGASSTGNFGYTEYSVGARDDGTAYGSFYSEEIIEVIVCDRDVTDGEMGTINTYLDNKYTTLGF